MSHLEDGHDHILPATTYYGIFAVLMVLTAATVGAAFVDLGPLNILVALTIAVVKASLVVLIFMHVKYADKVTWVVVASGFVMLGFLLFITLADYVSRGWSLMH